MVSGLFLFLAHSLRPYPPQTQKLRGDSGDYPVKMGSRLARLMLPLRVVVGAPERRWVMGYAFRFGLALALGLMLSVGCGEGGKAFPCTEQGIRDAIAYGGFGRGQQQQPGGGQGNGAEG